MANKNTINISIVEDNNLFRISLKSDIETTFSNQQLAIRSYATGEDCMSTLKDFKPNIVILDYNLDSNNTSAANGIKILDAIKRIDSEISVVMLTSQDNIEIALQSFKHGASDYVVKTETKFRKINYALQNQFKIIEANKNAARYKYLVAGMGLCVALLAGGVIAIQIFAPNLLR